MSDMELRVAIIWRLELIATEILAEGHTVESWMVESGYTPSARSEAYLRQRVAELYTQGAKES
jgi:hypothetical protein